MLAIADEEVLRTLKADNPWWESGISPPGLERFPKSRAYFRSFQEIALNWEVQRSVVLMGSRRVGKTVMLQQLIGQAIDDGFPAGNIFFASLDTPMYSGIPLDKLLALFESRIGSGGDARRIVVFDEVQYLGDWEISLKVLTDRHPEVRFIVSGSAGAALRLKSQESGAGRFTEFLLPPLTFAEFLDFTDRENELIESRGEGCFQARDIEQLNAEFINYLNIGGYPEAALNPDVRRDASRYLGRDIVDKVLLRDLPSLYGIRDIQELNRLFMSIAYHSGQEISLSGLASSAGVAKNTISRYLEYLEAAFLIIRVRRVDDSGRTFQRARHFKAYLTNPSMRAMLFAPLDAADEAMGAMAETAIFSQWYYAGQSDTIHYARWKRGRQYREVDLVRIGRATRRPIQAYEVKWSDRYVDNPRELKGLIAFARENREHEIAVGASSKTRASRTPVADGIDIDHSPCALHCYQVGRNGIER